MSQYKIIAGDKKEYGPVSVEEVDRWIQQGRANGDTRVQAEGSSDWVPLREMPELAVLLGEQVAPAPGGVASQVTGAEEDSPLPSDLETRDHSVWSEGCFGRGFEVYQSRFGMATGMFAALLGILLAVWVIMFFVQVLLAFIPILGIIISFILQMIVSLVLVPLYVGPGYFFIKATRGQPGRFGDLFAGYSRALGQCLLCSIVQSLIMMAVMVPGMVITAVSSWPLFKFMIEAVLASFGGPDPDLPDVGAGHALGFLVGIVVICLPIIYLSTCWSFSLLLVVDRRMGFWKAMQTSRQVVNRHWFMMFFFLLVVGMIASVGIFLCCIGLLFTAPMAIAMMAEAYVHLFDKRPGEAAAPAQP